MWTAQFWKGVAERAIWSFAATLVGIMSADGFDLMKVDVKAILIAALVAALFSFLKSIVIGASGIGPAGSPSAVYDRPSDPT